MWWSLMVSCVSATHGWCDKTIIFFTTEVTIPLLFKVVPWARNHLNSWKKMNNSLKNCVSSRVRTSWASPEARLTGCGRQPTPARRQQQQRRQQSLLENGLQLWISRLNESQVTTNDLLEKFGNFNVTKSHFSSSRSQKCRSLKYWSFIWIDLWVFC